MVNCLGAKSLEQAQRAVLYLEEKLRHDLNESNLTLSSPTVSNIVAYYRISPAPLDLNILYNYWKDHGIPGNVYYEAELYPALKITLPLGTLLVYHTGKVVMTGVKSINHLPTLQQT